MKLVRLFLFLGLLLPGVSNADTFWIFSLKVKHIATYANGYVHVLFYQNGAVYQACENVDWYEFQLDSTPAEAMQSSLLTALVADKEVGVVFDCSDSGIKGVRIDQ